MFPNFIEFNINNHFKGLQLTSIVKCAPLMTDSAITVEIYYLIYLFYIAVLIVKC